MDEVVITIGGEKFLLLRAIDADGDVLDVLVHQRRKTTAARRFFSRLGKQLGSPRAVVRDKLGSYVKPVQAIAPDADHRVVQIASPSATFLAGSRSNRHDFRPRRHNLSTISYRHARVDAFSLRADCTEEMAPRFGNGGTARSRLKQLGNTVGAGGLIVRGL